MRQFDSLKSKSESELQMIVLFEIFHEIFIRKRDLNNVYAFFLLLLKPVRNVKLAFFFQLAVSFLMKNFVICLFYLYFF